MFTNITENCVVSPSGSSPSSAVVGDWHTYDNCWRVRAARSAARVKVGPVPSTALSRTNRAPAAVRFCVPLRSVPFRAVLSVCLTGLPAPSSVHSLMSADFDGWPLPVMVRYVIHACHVADDTICHVGLADLSLFAISPFRFPPQRTVSFGERALVGKPFQCPGSKTPESVGTESSKITLLDLIIDPGVYFQTLDGTSIRDLKRVSVFTFKSWPVCFKTPLLVLLK